MNLTPTEYDTYVRNNGVRAALAHFPYTLSYRYSTDGSEWTLFFSSDIEREGFANGIRRMRGEVTGASGGDTKLYK